jgi:hypothetical protein
MAKAALEAINGCNLFGDKGASWSVIYVDIDAHNRNRSIFETMLPRESSSKVQHTLTMIRESNTDNKTFVYNLNLNTVTFVRVSRHIISLQVCKVRK